MKHPLEHRSTKSFLSTVSALALLVAITGCSTPEQITVAGDTDSDVKPIEELSYKESIADEQDFKLWNGDFSVEVGNDESEALAAFEPPPKSFSVRSLPGGFGEEFSAAGWERTDHVFACILYKKKIVLAMHTREAVSDEDIIETLAKYRNEYGIANDQYGDKRIQFHYWFTGDRMLMVSTAIDINDKKSMTAAIGVPEVMKQVGMDPAMAQADIDEALRSITEQKISE